MMKGPKAGASSIAIRAFRGVQAVAAGRERRERPSRCRHYLPLRRGSLRRASCVVVRCRRRAVAVLVLWIVEHSAGQVRAGVHRALLCCVRRGARQRNLLDELVPHLFQWLALPPPGLSSPLSRRPPLPTVIPATSSLLTLTPPSSL